MAIAVVLEKKKVCNQIVLLNNVTPFEQMITMHKDNGTSMDTQIIKLSPKIYKGGTTI